jgi:hydrophobic/amphiphilic exporter-1 (mainly G- bacteria), HAE1 family
MVNDKSHAIKESIFDVQFTLFLAFILVVMVIYIYLGEVRDTIIPILVLPMSVIGTFAVMYVLGYSLDNLSLLALILVIGFIIDDAIVVIENIVRRIEKGETPWQAAMEGSKQISFTIVSMTLSLIAVFIPLLFMAGLIGRILSEFALTLTIVTLISGFISLTLNPMLCSLFIRVRKKDEKKHGFNLGLQLNEKMLERYKPALLWVLDHRLIPVTILLVSVVLSALLLIALPKDFMPNDDIGFFIVYTQSAEGTSWERMVDYQKELEEIFQKDPNIDRFISIASNQQFRNGMLYVHLKPLSKRKPVTQVMENLKTQTDKVVGVNAYYKNIPLIDLSIGAQVKGAYQYALQGFDAKTLYPAAQAFLEKMATIKGVQGLNTDLEIHTPQLFVDILRNEASTYGITAQTIENAFDFGYSGNRVSRIQTPINQYDVILELDPIYQREASILNTLYVRSTTSQQLVPLSAVAHWYEGLGPNSINHFNQLPAVTASYNLTSDVSLSEVLEKIKKIAAETLPYDVIGMQIGAARAFEDSIYSAVLLLIVTVITIYIALGILYESYIHPLTILTTLPPATVGGLLTLYFFGYSLSLYSFLGIILLIGIVKKNGIMMVDFALENINVKGESPKQSIYEASIVRFRPIMMTTLTAIVGALPIALGFGAGAEARRPLGLVIIGGLLLSQLITLFVTPVIYLYMEELRERVWNSKGDA